ncbi:MAG: sodium transport system ATP-binding protein [Myxococcota bacterium]|jgi:sodium transport system ATP-binding protein
MIEARGLTKRFAGPDGPITAVDDLSFRVEPGTILGLLGPNGAGKTTTLRILGTLLAPDAGSATIAGHDVRADPAAVRAIIGFVSPDTGLYDRLTVRETLRWFGRLYGIANPRNRAEALIERFDLTDHADQRCSDLSTGNKQKTSIARALVHDPPVLVFDEPTAGLDVLVGATLLEELERVRDEGRTVLFSTHVMREAERLCDNLVIVHEGRALARGTWEALQAQTGEHYLEDVFLTLVRQSREGGA